MGNEVLNVFPIVDDIQILIDQSRQNALALVNAEATLLYWRVGKRINDEVLQNSRAEYGKQVVVAVSKRLTQKYGRGWGEFQLRQCMQLAIVFLDEKILYAVRTELFKF